MHGHVNVKNPPQPNSPPKALQIIPHRKGQQSKYSVTTLLHHAHTCIRDASVKLITVWFPHEYFCLQRYLYKQNFVVIWQQNNIRVFKVKTTNIKRQEKGALTSISDLS